MFDWDLSLRARTDGLGLEGLKYGSPREYGADGADPTASGEAAGGQSGGVSSGAQAAVSEGGSFLLLLVCSVCIYIYI